MRDGLTLSGVDSAADRWQTAGVWALYQSADRMYASRQEPFLVTETKATSIGMAWDNRPAYADQLGRARPEPAPARLVEAAGIRYDEFANLDAELRLSGVDGGPLRLPGDTTATRWADGVTVLEADVRYRHPHFGRWPAVTTRRHGAGRITYVGTVPGTGLARALATWLAPIPVSGWTDLPPSVSAATATAPDGRRVHVVHNWGWQPVGVATPGPLRDALTDESVSGVDLGPWDVRILR